MTAVNVPNQQKANSEKETTVEKQVTRYAQQLQQQHQEVPGDPPATPPAAPATEPATIEPADTTPQARPGSRVLSMPTAAMSEIKRKERERGERKARQAADAQAKELGYASHEDMLAKLKAAKARPAAKPAAAAPASAETEQAPPATRRQQSKAERDLARMEERRRSANRARASAERRVRELERQRDADSAEHELRLSAVKHGVHDVDYALTLLKRKLSGLKPEELRTFDEDTFFSVELRKSNPYLYGEEVRPATTSPSSSSSTKPTTTNPPAADTKTEDARTVSQDKYNEMLRKRGLTPPQHGMPS